MRIVLALHGITKLGSWEGYHGFIFQNQLPVTVSGVLFHSSSIHLKSLTVFSYLTRYLFTLAALGTLGDDQETSMLSELTSVKRRSDGAGTAGARRDHCDVMNLFPK